MKENKLVELSMDFAVAVIRLCGETKGHAVLMGQLERAATSIGANIHEANYAHGRQDFVAKLQIALKECYETEYWIELFARAAIFGEEDHQRLAAQCGTLRRILIASINTARRGHADP